jgi:hypothetical protein
LTLIISAPLLRPLIQLTHEFLLFFSLCLSTSSCPINSRFNVSNSVSDRHSISYKKCNKVFSPN